MRCKDVKLGNELAKVRFSAKNVTITFVVGLLKPGVGN